VKKLINEHASREAQQKQELKKHKGKKPKDFRFKELLEKQKIKSVIPGSNNSWF